MRPHKYLVALGGSPMYRTRTLAEARSLARTLQRREAARARVRVGDYGSHLVQYAEPDRGAVTVDRLPIDMQ